MERSNNSLIVKCSHCKQILSSEPFDEHDCHLELLGVEKISVIDFMDTSCNEKKTIQGHGVNGILYVFEVSPRKPIPFIKQLSDASYHGKDSDDKLPVPECTSVLTQPPLELYTSPSTEDDVVWV